MKKNSKTQSVMNQTIHETLKLADKLPEDVFDEIQFEMVIWSGLEMMKMGSEHPNEKKLEKFTIKSEEKYKELLKKARQKLDEASAK